MKYLSTRGGAPTLDFEGVMLAGLASDGGLYVPASVPQFSAREISALARLSYTELAYAIIAPYVGNAFSAKALHTMIAKAYHGFGHAAVAPLTQLSHNHFLLELFHGPSLSFKDFALQLLGQMIATSVSAGKKPNIVLGATSGDTGSAAIAGCMGAKHLEIVILYPKGRTSDIQRKQMTTTGAKNVHALAVDGTFDDCQALVKTLFSDVAFRQDMNLYAVNSINWARVMAQIVYYFYAGLALGAPARRAGFTVPTGNFGDIFAGYMARQMGLPMGTLTIASNANDILTRCYRSGTYKVTGVNATLSPSMDIQVSSNFERLLFDLHGRDAKTTARLMAQFAKTGSIKLSPAAHRDFKRLFSAQCVSDRDTLRVIQENYAATGLLLDPHSAVGVAASAHSGDDMPVITLATAHPAKFPDAVKKATRQTPALPSHLADLPKRKEKIIAMKNDSAALKRYLSRL